MRYAILPLLIALGACRGRATSDQTSRRDTADVASVFTLRRDSTDSLLRKPRVIADAAVVVFWLRAADTLAEDDRASALDDLQSSNAEVFTLKANDILLPRHVPTRCSSSCRTAAAPVLLGLDYPFGYVLVDPGAWSASSRGYADDDPMDELRAYFDLSDDSVSTGRDRRRDYSYLSATGSGPGWRRGGRARCRRTT
jgi:hypothetical protein